MLICFRGTRRSESQEHGEEDTMMNPGEEAVARSRFLQWLPVVEREQRRNLHEYFEASGTWNVDFVIMMGLSTALAAFGLLNNSAAAVIGAMLVAPLMSPLLGAGFALVQGNFKLFRSCIKAMSYGTAVALPVSLIIGLITPGYDPTAEIEARGQVNLLDLGVALASGMAAAYATARPNLAATLSGVAIAAALVPPLAVVGIAAASGEFALSGYSAVLFLTNVVAIILGAALVFRLVGVQGALGESTAPLWARRARIGLILATVVLIIPLGNRLQTQLERGQVRPASYPLSTNVRNVILERVDSEPGIEMIAMARYATAPEAGAQVILAAEVPVPHGFVEYIEGAIRSVAGPDAIVRVTILQAARGAVLEAPKIEDEEG
jgi:uncharacterized hydrophobic protein (TIGR00271 family)